MRNKLTALNFKKELKFWNVYMCFVILNDAIISLSCQIDIFLRWSDTFANECICNAFKESTFFYNINI